MFAQVTNPMPLGVSGKVSKPILLGSPGAFRDADRNSADAKSGVVPFDSGMLTIARLVINDSGGALAPGLIVTHDAGTTYGPGKAVDGAAGDDGHPAGVVDPWLPSGTTVADGDFFWLILKGPCYVQSDGNAIATPGTRIQTDASGQARAYVEGTDDWDSVIGVNIEAATTTAGALYKCLLDIKNCGL